MRRALLKQLPALTHFYGLRPEDIERMTEREITEYVVHMQEHQREGG
jgi:hypothetical protein